MLCGLLVAALSAAPLALLTASQAEAYALLGCRWPSGGITYKSNTTGAYTAPTTAAINDWTNNTVVTFIPKTSGAQFSIINGAYGNTGWDGRSSSGCSGGYFVSGAVVQLNEYYGNGYVANKKRSVIAHELGHIVGLDHWNPTTCLGRPVMFESTPGRYVSCGVYTVQSDDKSGANAIY